MKKVEERESLANNDNLRAFMGKYGIDVVMVFMLVLISILQPKFLNISNFSNILTQISINSLIAYGMCLAITTGGIDLTVGAQLALVSCVTGWAMVDKGMGVLEAVALGLCITTITGFVSGLLIAKFQMFPFVVTLSMQLVVRSLAQIVSNGKGKSMTDVAFKSIYTAKLFDVIPMPIIYLVLCVIVMYGLMHWTKLGRYIYSVGGNEKAAIASGVNVFWVKVIVYTISGFLAGCAGILFTAKTGSAQSNIGIGYETDAIAACVLGGTSFTGGESTAVGVLIGAIIIGCIYNGMNFLGINSYYQSLTKGAIIILVVLLNMAMTKKNT